MDAVLNWLWQGCVVALALAAMLRLLERAPANSRYFVCWAALLLVVALPALPWLGSLGLQQDALGFEARAAIVSVPDTWWTSGAAMVAAWIVWVTVYTGRFMWAMVALRRARARSRAFPMQVESQLSHWSHVRDMGRRPSLVVSEAVTTAAVLGCGAPMVAVAPSLVAALDADDLDRVLIHEWVHVQRRDDLVNVLQVLLRVAVGWHPAAWWIDRRLHVEREIACDETTIEVTGSAKSYAECLVRLAGLKGGEQAALAPAVLTVSGLRARVTRIVSRHTFIAPSWSRGIATAIVSALCLLSVGVGGLTLVEPTVLALPFDSLRAINTGLQHIAPVAMPSLASRITLAPSLKQTATSVPSTRRPIEEKPPTITAADPQEPLTSIPESAVESTELRATAESNADIETVPDPSAVAAAVPSELPHETVESSRTVSSVAVDAGTAIARKSAEGGSVIGRKSADGGIAIGQASKEAGVATAGFFTRVARRVAGSF